MHAYSRVFGGLLALAFASGAGADEVQITITGTACTLMSEGCGTPEPYAISFDVNTTSGQLAPYFSSPCGPCLLTASTSAADGGAPFTVSNYSAVVGGESVGSSGTSVFGLQLTAMGAGADINGYEFDMSTSSGLFLNTGVLPTITQAQYMTFKDPLAALLLEFFPTPAAPACCLNATLAGTYGLETANIAASVVPPTGVAEPGLWSLWLLGLVGLGFARVRRTVGRRMPGAD